MDIETWKWIGLGAQAVFGSRFAVQWLVSEARGESVIPRYFWWASLAGAAGLLAYAIHIHDPVFILGQSFGIVVYIRNLTLRRAPGNGLGRTMRLSVARPYLVAAAVVLMVWLVGLTAYPLLESTEGRYASIASEMAHEGNWMEPRYNGALHFEKPPLAYWAGALALKLLPHGELAVRVPPLLAWLVAAWLVFRIARASGLDVRRSRWAAVFSSLAPLSVVQGRMLSCDIFLWPAILMVYLAVLEERWPRLARAVLAGAGLGCGLLAKGHMVLFWTALPIGLWAAWTRRWRDARLLLHPLTLLTMLGVGLPWYLLELRQRPELLSFWLGRETVGRYFSSVHGRSEAWWYFPVILPAMILPWLPEVARGAGQALRQRTVRDQSPLGTAESRPHDAARLWLLWVGVPLVLLCCSTSKRSNYLLPAMAPLALLGAAALRSTLPRLLRARVLVWLSLALLYPFALSLPNPWTPPTRALIAAARAAGEAPVAYHALPSSAPFYWGANLEEVPAPPERATAGTAATQAGDPDPSEIAGEVLAKGGLVMAHVGCWPELARSARTELEATASGGDWVLLRANGERWPQPSELVTPPRPEAPKPPLASAPQHRATDGSTAQPSDRASRPLFPI